MTRPTALSETAIWIVITGNIRSGREFQGMLAQALDLRLQGLIDGILFATWRHELLRFPDLAATLADLGVATVAIEPPAPLPSIHPLFHGYVLHQRKALHFALRALPEKCFVLKARTDFAEERFAAMTQSLFGNSGSDWDVKISQPVLHRRLFTFDARTDYFFYWDDIVFCGLREDLMALNNFELSPEVVYPAQVFSAEMRLFAPLFLRHYPALAWCFENAPGEKLARILHRWTSDGGSAALPDLLREILASYFHILTRYLVLPGSENTSRRELGLPDLFRNNPEFGIKAFPTPWLSHKLVARDPLLGLSGKSHEPETAWLQARLIEMDHDPAGRGRLPLDLTGEASKLADFGRRYGEEIETSPADYLPAATRPGQATLDKLDLPEERFPPWWKQKETGLRRKLAKWTLRKLL